MMRKLEWWHLDLRGGKKFTADDDAIDISIDNGRRSDGWLIYLLQVLGFNLLFFQRKKDRRRRRRRRRRSCFFCWCRDIGEKPASANKERKRGRWKEICGKKLSKPTKSLFWSFAGNRFFVTGKLRDKFNVVFFDTISVFLPISQRQNLTRIPVTLLGFRDLGSWKS